ncbi:MAG: hypothetical protein ACREQD_09985, partial [Candidatus Binataceae bacterium]
ASHSASVKLAQQAFDREAIGHRVLLSAIPWSSIAWRHPRFTDTDERVMTERCLPAANYHAVFPSKRSIRALIVEIDRKFAGVI